MTPKDYLEQSGRTVSPLEITILNLKAPHKLELLHAILGISGEAGELTDAIKKGIFYQEKSKIDIINIEEELGDILWYVALALRTIGSDFETCMKKNINKLKLRYPDKFTEEAYINRDLAAERKALGNNLVEEALSVKGSEGFTPMVAGKEVTPLEQMVDSLDVEQIETNACPKCGGSVLV